MTAPTQPTLTRVARFPGLRALAWSGSHLYASRGYQLLRARIEHPSDNLKWQNVAQFHPAWYRQLSVTNRLTARRAAPRLVHTCEHPAASSSAACAIMQRSSRWARRASSRW